MSLKRIDPLLVAGVCHHGGAGTTAAGLRAGKPTIIVPFFGDQFFWGSIVHKSGAGPAPIPGNRLKTQDLINAFRAVYENPDLRLQAERLKMAFHREDGCRAAVNSFYANLPLEAMRCDLQSHYPACFRLDTYNLKISRPAAQVLVTAGMIRESDLTINPTRDWSASLVDTRRHVPTHGLFKHGQRAFRSLFVEPAQNIKHAAQTQDFTTGTLDGAESVVKGVGKCIGHIYLGTLAFYGEMTDTIERVPNLYDRYWYIDHHERPRVTDFKSGADAACLLYTSPSPRD